MADAEETINEEFEDIQPAPEPQALVLNPKRFFLQGAIGIFIIVVCVICVVILFNSKLGNETIRAENEKLKRELGESSFNRTNFVQRPNFGQDSNLENYSNSAPAIDIASIEEKIALGKAAIAGFKAKLSKLSDDFESTENMKKEINRFILDLQTSEAGKRIAGNPEHVRQFINIVDSLLIENPALLEIPSFVQEYQSFFENTDLNPRVGYRPSPESAETLNRLNSTARARAKFLSDIDVALQSIILRSSGAPEKGLLSEAVLAKRNQMADEIAARIERSVQQVRENEAQKTAQALAEAEQKQLEADRKLKIARIQTATSATEDEEKRLNTKIEEARKQAELEARENALRTAYRREKPTIRSYLTPFISDGRELRGNNKGIGPVSHGLLISSGATEEGRRGLTILLRYGGFTVNRSIGAGINDRARGGFPEFRGSYVGEFPGVYPEEYLERVQRYLRDYGKFLVEDGLLAE